MPTITINPANAAQIAVDAQKGFMPGAGPGFNELPAPDGDQIVPTIVQVSDLVRITAASGDGHTPDHDSFDLIPGQDVRPDGGPDGIWPVHCVAGTPGADLHPQVAQAVTGPDWVFWKGTIKDVDAYSATRGANDNGDDLIAKLRAERIDTVIVTGLVTNVCVLATVTDLLDAGFRVIVVLDGVRGIPGGGGLPTPQQAVEQMARAGAVIVNAASDIRTQQKVAA